MTTLRTTSEHADFIRLVRQLDAYLAVIDGSDHAFYSQYNQIDTLQYVVVLYGENNETVACGAIKPYGDDAMEVKRMFVTPEKRGKGIATLVLQALEQWTTELGKNQCVLETGKRMQDAVNLYLKNGYAIIPNYGQYIGVENSVCLAKNL